jgi:hypothetical protein
VDTLQNKCTQNKYTLLRGVATADLNANAGTQTAILTQIKDGLETLILRILRIRTRYIAVDTNPYFALELAPGRASAGA